MPDAAFIPSPDDTHWMAQAIRLAAKGCYTTRPNPNVGCVLIKNGERVGEGYHYRAGEAHAEIHALKAAGERAQGATAYVSLEPCSHTGKTGPCSQALIAAGVARVVYAMEDPNPQVAGRGLEQLREAGVEVSGPLLEQQAKDLNPGFISAMTRQRPWLRCKMAISLDGRTAMASGESQWITGAAARADVQRWRARSSAIITGVDSILADNSRLNLRAGELDLASSVKVDVLNNPPLRVVLDTQLRTPADAAVLTGDAPTLILTCEAAAEKNEDKVHALQTAGATVKCISTRRIASTQKNGLDLHAVLACLHRDYQCGEVLLETGATLVGAFFDQGLIDELIIYQAPLLLGSSARPFLGWSIEQMADKQPLKILDSRRFGEDTRIIAIPHNSQSSQQS